MINNSTNIKNKQSPLSSDGQQFHQYQLVYIGGIVDHHCWEVIVCFVDIGGIVDHHCLEVIVCFFYICVSTKKTITSKQLWSAIPPISTKQTIISKQ
jgi:hypothetical protein